MKRFLNFLLNKKWILNIVMPFLSDIKQERIRIAILRSELAFWGYDTSKMTDEEIKEGLYKVKEVAVQFGVTSEELAAVLKEMNSILKKNNINQT